MSPGARVRLVRLCGVASDTMRRCVGTVGTVDRVRGLAGRLEAKVTFDLLGVSETFWLARSEIEPVDPPVEQASAPGPEPAVESPEERAIVADFVTAVQRRIEQLSEEDLRLEQQIREIQAQRDGIARERASLKAAILAYEREKARPSRARRPEETGPKALPSPERTPRLNRDLPAGAARAFLREWAEAHGGRIERHAMLLGAVERGISTNSVLGLLQKDRAYERVERGVYLLRGSAS